MEVIHSSPPEVFFKKVALKNFTKISGKHLLWSHSDSKFTPAQVCSSEFYENFKNTYLVEDLRKVASVLQH